MNTVTVHTLVKNEARFVWFAVMSVIEHVDKILLWDTGSTDGTVEICREIKRMYPRKVDFREVGEVTPATFTQVRQKMLDDTKTQWFLVVDGDEVWWEDSVKRVVDVVKSGKGGEIESVVVPTINLVGDIFHYQEEAAGRYKFGRRVGHYNLRLVNRNIPGLCSSGEHGVWGWADGDGKMIQDRNSKKVFFVDAPYLHATHLQRAGEVRKDADVPKRLLKRKYELGISFPKDFYYPEVFFRERPEIVSSVWAPMDFNYKLRAFFETPLKKVKRRIIPGGVGY